MLVEGIVICRLCLLCLTTLIDTAFLRRENQFVYANDSFQFEPFRRADSMKFAMQNAVELVYQLHGTIENYIPVNYTIGQAYQDVFDAL